LSGYRHLPADQVGQPHHRKKKQSALCFFGKNAGYALAWRNKHKQHAEPSTAAVMPYIGLPAGGGVHATMVESCPWQGVD